MTMGRELEAGVPRVWTHNFRRIIPLRTAGEEEGGNGSRNGDPHWVVRYDDGMEMLHLKSSLEYGTITEEERRRWMTFSLTR
jgi:hypothetical protein